MTALQLTEEQKDKVQPWLCRIAKDKGIDAPNGLDISLAESSFDEETDRYSIRVHDDSFDEDGILAHGVTLVFEDSRIDALIEASRPPYWREAEEEQAVAIREGTLILKAVKDLKKGLFADGPTTSFYKNDLWRTIFRKGSKDGHGVRVQIVRTSCGVLCNPSGKVRVHVTGRYDGPKKDFLQRKDGSVNHEAIAKFVLDVIEEWSSYDESREKQNQDFLDCRVAVTIAVGKYDIATHIIDPDYGRKVRISFRVTPEKLDHVIEVLVREGFIKRRSNLGDDPSVDG